MTYRCRTRRCVRREPKIRGDRGFEGKGRGRVAHIAVVAGHGRIVGDAARGTEARRLARAGKPIDLGPVLLYGMSPVRLDLKKENTTENGRHQ